MNTMNAEGFLNNAPELPILREHSIIGTLKLTVKKNEWVYLDYFIYEVKDFMIPAVHSYEYVAEVLDCEFENHEDRQVISIVFSTDLDAKTEEEAAMEVGYRLQSHMLNFKQIEVKEYGKDGESYEFEVIHASISFDLDTFN